MREPCCRSLTGFAVGVVVPALACSSACVHDGAASERRDDAPSHGCRQMRGSGSGSVRERRARLVVIVDGGGSLSSSGTGSNCARMRVRPRSFLRSARRTKHADSGANSTGDSPSAASVARSCGEIVRDIYLFIDGPACVANRMRRKPGDG